MGPGLGHDIGGRGADGRVLQRIRGDGPAPEDLRRLGCAVHLGAFC